MIGAFLAGAASASSLLIGCFIALVHRVPPRVLGLVMAFGGGVLISAVAYDLVADAFDLAKGDGIAIGLLCGSLAFYFGDLLIDRAGGHGRKAMLGGHRDSAAKAIVLGTVLDGVPESVVVGLSFLAGEGLGLTVLAAVFLSNLPEAMAATTGLRASGRSPKSIIGMWAGAVVASALAAGLGYWLLDGAGPATVAFVQSFAAGAILTMLADTMMPEAYEHGGRIVGLATTLGFTIAFAVASLEVLG